MARNLEEEEEMNKQTLVGLAVGLLCILFIGSLTKAATTDILVIFSANLNGELEACG